MITPDREKTSVDLIDEYEIYYPMFNKLTIARRSMGGRKTKEERKLRTYLIENNTMELLTRKCSVFNSQLYGPLLQDKILHDFQIVKIAAKMKRGDGYSRKLNKYVEIKTSLITPWDPNIQIVQIRPDHKVDYMLVYAADVTPKIPVIFVYVMTHSEITEEFVTSSAHGSGKEVFERRITIPYDTIDENYKKLQKYAIDYTAAVKMFT